MPHDKLPKSVDPQPDKSRQGEKSMNNPVVNPNPVSRDKPVHSNVGEDPDAPYGDPGTAPGDLPYASDPDPEADPMVSRDAAQPIATGREDQAIAERQAAEDAGQSPEFEADLENRRVHGQHHERVGGRPLESFAPMEDPSDPHREAPNISGLNPHVSIPPGAPSPVEAAEIGAEEAEKRRKHHHSKE